jgi:hypothetical protein
MKHILVFSLLFSGLQGFSQDYMDKIIEKSCECVDKVPDTLEIQKYNMELGLCMINASMPYKKQLKKDYDINLDKLDPKTGEKLGTTIALKMGSVCPNGLLKLSKKTTASSKPEKSVNTAQGVISNIENNNFVVFSLTDDAGKISKFYWLSFIDADFELTGNYNSLIGKEIKFTYDVRDYFDPKILEYRQFNIISKIEKVDN